MVRYFIRFSYLGTHYRGLQKNAIPKGSVQMHDTDTIQGALECAFSTLVPKSIEWPKLTLSSRTDAGVHSLCNAAHIDLQNRCDWIYNPDDVLSHVNRYLIKCHHNIRLLEFIPVSNDFHARVFAKSRTYIYRFMRAKIDNEHRIPVSEMNCCFHLRSQTFDIERIKNATQLFMGTKDFTTFSAKSISSRPIRYVRNLDRLIIEKGHPFMPFDPLSRNFEFWNIVCSAKGFLYKQVRRIAGSLLALSMGKITEKDISTMLQVPGHHNWIPSIAPLPGHGLYLAHVEYCQKEIDEYSLKYNICPDNKLVMPCQ